MSLEAIAQIAKPHGVPILVDAAAEILTVPSIHLQRGATLVAYSGGKILRGPQSAGVLLGRKDLVKAAWIHSAPHHGYARAMKIGREEVVGMLVAIERWVKGDRAAEWAAWVRQAEVIAAAAERVPGVTAVLAREPWEDRSNRSPRVTIRWTASQIGLTGQQAADLLYDDEPRIAIGGASGSRENMPGDTGIALTTSMLAPGDEQIVAERVRALLAAKRTLVGHHHRPHRPVTWRGSGRSDHVRRDQGDARPAVTPAGRKGGGHASGRFPDSRSVGHDGWLARDPDESRDRTHRRRAELSLHRRVVRRHALGRA